MKFFQFQSIKYFLYYYKQNMQSKVQLVLEDGIDITIKISEPILDPVGGFTTYLISGNDKLGSFQIRRRFNEFFLLRQALTKNWPGCYIPPVPSKKVIGNKEDKTVQQRRRFLQYFCVKVSGIKYIYYCDAFQQFLRNKSLLLQHLIQTIERIPTAQIVNIYKQLFNEQLQQSSTTDLRGVTNNFNAYLKKAEKQLKTLRQQIKDIADAKKIFNDNLNVCNTIMMPEYEKNVLIQYVNQQQNNLLYLNDNQVNQKIRELRDFTAVNSFDFLVDLITFELKQVQALQQSIQTREFYEQKKKKLQQKKASDKSELLKLTSGKTTFKSIFSRGSKQEQAAVIQKSLIQDEKEIQSLTIIIDYIVIVLGLIQIPKFKAYKQTQYYDTISQVSKLELKHLGIYGTLMKNLLVAHQRIKIE